MMMPDMPGMLAHSRGPSAWRMRMSNAAGGMSTWAAMTDPPWQEVPGSADGGLCATWVRLRTLTIPATSCKRLAGDNGLHSVALVRSFAAEATRGAEREAAMGTSAQPHGGDTASDQAPVHRCIADYHL
ncbi:hypothetical protein FDG2_3415 [Candidatus Protofrankia californiensis]|uniref:Uncharacterized protein n=1 Tax=Candidatus Protofrankia californiensis TaxID=1839754 RepID=A0A1C3NZJ5_9ACTN|nr:hypothetical protein FDG2_3415 [Candidatus Protofrankia californiensis]